MRINIKSFPPSLIITVADHEVDTSWHERARADGAHIDHVVLPAPDQLHNLICFIKVRHI